MTNSSSGSRPPRDIIIVLSVIFCVIVFVAAVVVELYFLASTGRGRWGFILEHFPVVVGLPLAAAVSFLIVVLLPQAYGKIEFKALGLSFRGAAGPVVLW